MGRLGIESNPTVSNIRQWLMALQYYTTLAFAGISSITDVGNILLRARPETLREAASYTGLLVKSFADRKELAKQARLLGLIQHDTITSVINQSYGGTFNNPTVQKMNDFFFKANGLEWLTRTTRIMSMAAAQRFLENAVQESSKHGDRYLKDLRLTKEDVEFWISKGKPMGAYVNEQGVMDPRHTLNKVASAINQFVDESILRPNASQRPTWASHGNILAQLVWQLKSFFWAFGHTIIKGAARDIQARRRAGESIPMSVYPLVLGAIPIMALSALGLEIKELIKYGFTGRGQSNQMSNIEYAFDVFDRAGGLGPFGLATGMIQAKEFGNSPLLSLLGPTAEHAELFLRSPSRGIERTIPYISQTRGNIFGYDLTN
jgi:hypothetical protein